MREVRGGVLVTPLRYIDKSHVLRRCALSVGGIVVAAAPIRREVLGRVGVRIQFYEHVDVELTQRTEINLLPTAAQYLVVVWYRQQRRVLARKIGARLHHFARILRRTVQGALESALLSATHQHLPFELCTLAIREHHGALDIQWRARENR